jgi:flagellin-specific chaperone FliS
MMRNAEAYLKTQTMTLSSERAFEELYLRLARWTHEIATAEPAVVWEVASARLDRCIALLGYMSGIIDVEHNYEIAAAILSLHRFAISTLVQAKSQRDPAELDGLPQVFLALGEIFKTISQRRTASPAAPLAS